MGRSDGATTLVLGTAATAFLWTGLLGASFHLTKERGESHVMELATQAARAGLARDRAWRHWGAGHGGVYVPETDETPASRFLSHVPERDITTPTGRRLTLLNPAYMIRQVMEATDQEGSLTGHITSLTPLRPGNEPDEWERSALEQFETGAEEVVGITNIRGKRSLRMMKPLLTEEACLKCHGHQGYAVGDTRGGVSVSVPLSPYQVAELADLGASRLKHLGVYLLGLFILAGVIWFSRRRQVERTHATMELLVAKAELEDQVRDRTTELLASKEKQFELEARAVQAEKSESLERLAGEVAHDLNNVLTSIVGYSELIGGTLDPKSEAAKDLQEILAAAEGGSQLTGHLLAISSRQQATPEPFLLQRAIDASVASLKTMTEQDILFLLEVAEDCWPILFDSAQFERILLHLVVNAREAMPEGGQVTIRARNATLDRQRCPVCREHLSGEHVVVTVEDTGEGMDAAHLPRIFEPFFTTKSLSGGTGVGLSTVQGIVSQHGGHIWADSSLGEGTVFTICLPRYEEEQPRILTPEVPHRTGTRGSETILLAEDEAPLRRLALRTLNAAGYTVLEAEDGQEAVRLSMQHEGPIDLLLTDVIMPNLEGPEAYAKIAESRPDIAVIYMSGYIADALDHPAVGRQEKALLEKPYRREDMLRIIRSILDPSDLAEPANSDLQDDGPGPDTLGGPLDLHAELARDLIDLAENGDASGIRALLESRIRPDHPDISDNLESLLDAYDYGTIIELASRSAIR